MTALGINSKVARETRATYRGRALIVTITPHEVLVREKGRRLNVSIPITAVYDLGFKILAREARIEKLKKKGKA